MAPSLANKSGRIDTHRAKRKSEFRPEFFQDSLLVIGLVLHRLNYYWSLTINVHYIMTVSLNANIAGEMS